MKKMWKSLPEIKRGIALILLGVFILWGYFFILEGVFGLYVIPFHIAFILIAIGFVNYVFGKIKDLKW